jgi:hypothetical protein
VERKQIRSKGDLDERKQIRSKGDLDERKQIRSKGDLDDAVTVATATGEPILRADTDNTSACRGGYWRLVNDAAIDSGCVIPLVTSNEDIVTNNDPNGGLMMLQSSGSVAKADGRGETLFQMLSNHTETGEQHILQSSTGHGGTTLAKGSRQDLISSSFLSRNNVIPVQDHDNPRCTIRGKPGFEIKCTEVQNLWYLPICMWGGWM